MRESELSLRLVLRNMESKDQSYQGERKYKKSEQIELQSLQSVWICVELS